MLTFTVPGPPRGKGRPRFSRKGHVYTPEETATYENLVALAAARAMLEAGQTSPLDCPLVVEIRVRLPRPKKPKHSEPAVRPDLDQYVKAILDGMGQAQVYTDDARVVDLRASKEYATNGTNPCASVIVAPLNVLI